MNAQRSMTDEQMLAKYGYDKEPWVAPSTGRRSSDRFSSAWQYLPRPECIPSRDPSPWVFNYSGNRYSQIDPLLDRDWSFDPRPKFARPPFNRILNDLRDLIVTYANYPFALHVSNQLEDIEQGGWDDAATDEDIEFARAVLTRLANLTAVTL